MFQVVSIFCDRDLVAFYLQCSVFNLPLFPICINLIWWILIFFILLQDLVSIITEIDCTTSMRMCFLPELAVS